MFNPRINYSWIMGRQSFKTGYEYQAINTQIDDFNPKYGRDTYGGQFTPAGDGGGGSGDLQPRRLHARACAARTRSSRRSSPTCGSGCTSATCRTTSRSSPRLTLNAGLRYEYATPQYEKDNFLTNFDPATNTLIGAKDGSIYDRALVQPGSQQLRAAPRRRLGGRRARPCVRAGYGMSYIHFNRMGGENLLSFNGPHVVGLNINQTITQPLCVGNANPTTCFRTTQAGYPEGYTTPASFNPLNVRVNYIPKDTPTGNVQSWHASVQREILQQPARRRRLRRQQEPRHHDPRRLQPGAAQRGRRERVAPGAPADPGLPGNPDRVRRRQGGLPRAAGQGGAALHARPLSAELVHLVARARQRVGPPRGAERRQQPRELPRPRRGVRALRLRPAAQQHDQRRVGAAVRQGPEVRRRA